jgi:hypothetical protein
MDNEQLDANAAHLGQTSISSKYDAKVYARCCSSRRLYVKWIDSY